MYATSSRGCTDSASVISEGRAASLGYTPVRHGHVGVTFSLSKAYFTQNARGAALSLAPKWTGSLFADVAANPIGRLQQTFYTAGMNLYA